MTERVEVRSTSRHWNTGCANSTAFAEGDRRQLRNLLSREDARRA
jgi:hypothetical protein